jgi:alpha-tubulin suppressor-like RCC1 family protein
LITAYRLVDTAAKVGTTALAKNKNVDLLVLGKGNLPKTGPAPLAHLAAIGVTGAPVRAVWLQVQTVGLAGGGIRFSRSDGSVGASVAAVKQNRWTNSLVLAPVGADGKIRLNSTAALKSLRISIVGWVAEAAETSSRYTTLSGIVPVAAKGITATKVASNVYRLKVAGGAIGSQVAQVLVRANVESSSAGRIRTGASKSAATKSSAYGVPIAKKTVSTVVLPAKTSGGYSYLSVPKGAKVSGVAVIGWISAKGSAAKDTTKPAVKFTAIPGGKTSPTVTLSGTVADAHSGVRYVAVYASGTLLGSATLNTTTSPAKWTLKTTVYGTTKTLKAVAVDNAGNRAEAAQSVTVAIAKGTVWSWGRNNMYQLGDGTTKSRSMPVLVAGLTSVTAIVGGEETGYALKSDGTVWAWGSSDTSAGDYSAAPVKVAGLSGVSAIAPGMALKADGTVWAWGDNGSGELGNGTFNASSVPVKVSGLPAAKAIANSGWNRYAVALDGTVWAWGSNEYGGLGDGNTHQECKIVDEYGAYVWDCSPTPVKVAGLSGIVSVVTDSSDVGLSYAVKSDGTVWAWGFDDIGVIGVIRDVHRTPVQVAGLGGIVSLTSYAGSAHALQSDGTVWAWGSNTGGLLGDGKKCHLAAVICQDSPDSDYSSVPVKATVLTGVTSVNGRFALKSDGTVWRWGITPVRVPGLTKITSIADSRPFWSASMGTYFNAVYALQG